MNVKKLALLTIVILGALVLAACEAAGGTATPPRTSAPGENAGGDAELGTAPTLAEGSEEAVAAAVDHLSDELSTSSGGANVLSAQAVDWPDSSLGCPQPNESYLDVITPGYRIVIEIDGQHYEVHTDATGERIVLCDQGAAGAVDAAIAYLADQLGVSPGTITLLYAEEVQWPDTSLGCPEPGMGYAQVITPGFRVTLMAEGEEYEVHTDRTGDQVTMCRPIPDEVLDAAITYLADSLGIGADEITLLSSASSEWPDTSLGCPEPDQSYLQVITPGYKFTFEAGGEQYEIHTDEVGELIVLCPPPARE
ncbi:MAG: hypothetical protein JW900_10540 [Anaerolineae bacterium]|nr:hypothetical protein [Anaerolineae bacterium]